MNFQIDEKVKYLNSMLCEIDNLYQSFLLNQGLSDSEFVVLFSILELGEGCLQKDISDKSYINKKTTNSTIKKLEKRGLIQLKAGKYPNMHIYLTESGEEYITQSVLPILEVENKVMEEVDDSEFQKLSESFSRYIKIFKEKAGKFKKS